MDVTQVPAEPEQLRDGEGIGGVRGGGDTAECGPLQRGDLGGRRRVLEQQNPIGRMEPLGDAFSPDRQPGFGEDVPLPEQ